MALEPVSQDLFMKIAAEEGIPLPVAAAFGFVESDLGRNPLAYVNPIDRLRPNEKPDMANKIGKGTMQIIRGTFNQYMPGVDYDTATDDQLIRGAFRQLKARAQAADGSWDLSRLRDVQFGTGYDSHLGKVTTKDPATLEKFNRALVNVATGYSPGDDLYKVAAGKGPDKDMPIATKINPDGSVEFNAPGLGTSAPATVQPKVVAQQLEPLNVDFEALEAKRVAAQQQVLDQLNAVETEQRARLTTILEAAKVNPTGAMDQMNRTLAALQAAQNRLQDSVEAINFKSPTSNEGILGVFELAAKNLGAKLVYSSQVKQVNDLSKAAQDYNTVVTALMNQTAAAGPSVSNKVNAINTARLAGEAAISVDKKSIETDFKNLNIEKANAQLAASTELANLRLESQRQRAADASVLSAARARAAEASAKLSEAREEILRAKLETETGASNLQVATAAYNRYLKSKNPNATDVTFSTYDDFNKLALKDPEFKKNMGSFVAGLTQPSETVGTKLSRALFSVTDSTDQQQLSELKKRYDSAAAAAFVDIASRQYIPKGKTKKTATPGDFKMFMSDKEFASVARQADIIAAGSFNSLTTDDLNFKANPLNRSSYQNMLIAAGGDGGILNTLKQAGYDTSTIQSDRNLVIAVISNALDNRLPVDWETAKTQLADFYSSMAKLRASDPKLTDLGIVLNGNSYVVNARNFGTFDLANRGQLNSYVEVMKSVVERSRRGMVIPVR